MVDTVKPKKDSSMLIDIQYVKPSKANNQPDDYLYIIWRDMDTCLLYTSPSPRD